jgi:hypothetical protein
MRRIRAGCGRLVQSEQREGWAADFAFEAVDGPKKDERVEFDMYPVCCPDTVVLEAMRSFFSAR